MTRSTMWRWAGPLGGAACLIALLPGSGMAATRELAVSQAQGVTVDVTIDGSGSACRQGLNVTLELTDQSPLLASNAVAGFVPKLANAFLQECPDAQGARITVTKASDHSVVTPAFDVLKSNNWLSVAEMRRLDLARRYGADDAQAIIAGQVKVGMKSEEVVEAKGTPNNKEYVPPTDELWRYAGGNITISDGKVFHIGD